tara:strand:- start:30 stop:1175 length:1146 start_codon:yes stop_codon:yes gene_type:complete
MKNIKKTIKLVSATSLLFMTANILHAGDRNPLVGSWWNSYCSTMKLGVDNKGNITGKYASITGSAGETGVLGNVEFGTGILPRPWVNPEDHGQGKMGLPFSLNIVWSNVEAAAPPEVRYGDENWVSMFAGQYFPKMEKVAIGDNGETETIEEHLEILNGLLATDNSGLNNEKNGSVMAGDFWPQTLNFYRTKPEKCPSVPNLYPVKIDPDLDSGLHDNHVFTSADGEKIRLELHIDNYTPISGNRLIEGKLIVQTNAPNGLPAMEIDLKGLYSWRPQLDSCDTEAEKGFPKTECNYGISLTGEINDFFASKYGKWINITGSISRDLKTASIWSGWVKETSWRGRYNQTTLDRTDFINTGTNNTKAPRKMKSNTRKLNLSKY